MSKQVEVPAEVFEAIAEARHERSRRQFDPTDSWAEPWSSQSDTRRHAVLAALRGNEQWVQHLVEALPFIYKHFSDRLREQLEERLQDERGQRGEMHVWRASAFGDAIADLNALQATSTPEVDRG